MNETSSCEFWPDKPSRCWTVYVLFKFFSCLSLLGCLFIIVTIILFKLYKYFVQRLILFLSLSAFIKVLVNLLSVNKNHSACVAQAFTMQFFGWSELLWVCCITINIAMVIQGIQSQSYEKWFHIFTWGVALAVSLIPLIGHHYGPAGMWCWIERDATGFRFGTWYIPLMIIIIALVAGYIFISIRAFCAVNVDEGFLFETQQGRTRLQEEVKPLLAYPIIYLLFTLPILIYRIDDAVHPESPPKYALLILSVITSPMLGGINAVAFALYGDTLKMLSCNSIKSAFLSCGQDSQVRVTHNYDVTDSSLDNQALLYHRGDEEIQFSKKYGEEEHTVA